MNDIYWREPLWILAGLLPLLVALISHSRQQRQLNRYAQKSLHAWVTDQGALGSRLWRGWRTGSQIAAWLMFGLAAAGPRFPEIIDPALAPQPAAVMIVIDLSRSMDADDVYPSRGQYARSLPSDWLAESSDRIGVIVFAGHAHLLIPPTDDKQALADMLGVLGNVTLPSHGSQLAEALQLAYQELSGHEANDTIILISDGDLSDNEYQESLSLISKAPDRQIGLHIIGVGTPVATALFDGPGKWLMQDSQLITTRLNESGLKQMADISGGSYRRADPARPPRLSELWQPLPARIGSEHQGQVLWRELFAWPLLAGVAFYFFSLLSPTAYVAMRRLAVLVVASLASLNAQAGEPYTQDEYAALAHQAWQTQDYETAATHYAQLKGFTGRMGEGASCYRAGDFDCAVNAFSKAAWQAEGAHERAQASFNLGNSYFQQGDFATASVLFRDALRYQPDNNDFSNNLAFSEALERSLAERLRQLNAGRKGRPGKGWRTGQIEPGAVLDPDAGVSLSDPDSTEDTADGDDRRAQDINRLLEKGLSFARLAKDRRYQATSRQRGWIRSGDAGLEAASLSALWQRLVEMEEDILTPPETPRILPGVRPW